MPWQALRKSEVSSRKSEQRPIEFRDFLALEAKPSKTSLAGRELVIESLLANDDARKSDH